MRFHIVYFYLIFKVIQTSSARYTSYNQYPNKFTDNKLQKDILSSRPGLFFVNYHDLYRDTSLNLEGFNNIGKHHLGNGFTILKGSTRTGIAVPTDVALFGKTAIHYLTDEHKIIIDIFIPGVDKSDIRCGFFQVSNNATNSVRNWSGPMFIATSPKNACVQIWEKTHFTTRYKQNRDNSFKHLQRAYRLPENVDFRSSSALYNSGLLQIDVRLKHNMSLYDTEVLPYYIDISDEKEPIMIRKMDAVYLSEAEEKKNWIFNWKKFKQYKDEVDLSKIDIENCRIKGNIVKVNDTEHT